MLAPAFILASLWAQAEQTPPPAPAAAPAPATAAPAPAPPTAAPAPPATAPVVETAAPPLPANSLSVHVRYAYRVDSDSVVPNTGMTLGGEIEHRMRTFESGIELGVAFDFFYNRFAKDVIAQTGSDPTITSRTLSHTSFVLMQTTAWRYADTRLFAGIGAGLSIGYFSSPDVPSDARTSEQPLVRGALGMDFSITTKMAAILRVDYNHTFFHEAFTTSAVAVPLFGDFFDAGIGLLLRF
jgi:hypothetical protein